MNFTKYSPGPWSVGNVESAGGLNGVLDAEGQPIAFIIKPDLKPGVDTWAQVDANGALLAAAPVLLGACIAAIAMLEVALPASIQEHDDPGLDEEPSEELVRERRRVLAEHHGLSALRAAVRKARGGA